MNGIVEFRDGDISCVHHNASNKYEVYVTKCGEGGRYFFDSWDAVKNFTSEFYYFDDEKNIELLNNVIES